MRRLEREEIGERGEWRESERRLERGECREMGEWRGRRMRSVERGRGLKGGSGGGKWRYAFPTTEEFGIERVRLKRVSEVRAGRRLKRRALVPAACG